MSDKIFKYLSSVVQN